LMQRLNIKLLQGQMRLCAKVVTAMWQWPTIARASTLVVGVCCGTVLFKFTTSEDHQAALWGSKGLVGTKLGLDENLTPT
jgi:hypothetical protein